MGTKGNERQMARMRRCLRTTWTLALVGAFMLGGNSEARAQVGITMQSLQNQINSLKTQVNDQNAQINSLKTQVNGQNTQISNLTTQVGSLKSQVDGQNAQISSLQAQVSSQSSLTARLAGVEAKTAPLSVSGNSLFITGMNVFIQDGSGSTNSPSGLGNLIVGYNASRASLGAPDLRTGSHNLILGDRNNYSSYGGLVAGYLNSIGGIYATVTGGQQNNVDGSHSSISGGHNRNIERPVLGATLGRWTAGNLDIHY